MKKVLTVVIILAIIIFLSYVGTLPSDEKQENNSTNQTVITEKVNEETNDVENEIDTNNKIENEIVNDNTQNKVENTVSTETFEESPKTSEEKAIDIAKKDWGNDNNVNFSVEGIDGNGNYIVAVRDNSTVALAFYSVNISNETFTKREMN